MKKILTSLTVILTFNLFLTGFTVQAQSSGWQWAKSIGLPGDDGARGSACDKNGNVYVTGNITISSMDAFIAKYDPSGAQVWIKVLTGSGTDKGNAITVDKNGDIYVTGNFVSPTLILGTDTLHNTGSTDIFLAKYDSLGNVLWATSPAGTANTDEEADAITTDPNGNVFITGVFRYDTLRFGSIVLPYPNGYVVKYSSTGTALWAKTGEGDVVGASCDGLGNIYITGFYGGATMSFGGITLTNSDPWGGTWDVFVYKLNSSGTAQWAKSAGAFQSYESAAAVVADSSGNIYVTGGFGNAGISFGNITLSGNGAAEYFIVKYDPAGTVQWAQSAGGNNWDGGTALTVDKTGNCYAVGNFMTNITFGNFTLANASPGSYDIFVVKYDPSGYVLWAQGAGGNATDASYAVSAYSDKYVYVSGNFNSATLAFGGSTLTNYGNTDLFLAKYFACSDNNYAPICMVTVDSLSQNNIIYWDKTSYTNSVDSFLIYREIQTNLYLPIGAVPFDSLSLFVDTVRTKYFSTYFNSGDPNSGTFRYKIALRDTCGNISKMSAYHNTVFMINNNGTFSWPQLYSIENAPNPVGSYVLYRDDNNTGTWHGVNSVTGTQQTITDPNYLQYQTIANWQIRTLWSLSCTPTYRINDPNSTESAVVKSKSNITNNRVAGIKTNVSGRNVSLYPNPSAGNITLKSHAELGAVIIYNALGEIVYQQKTKENMLQVDLSKHAAGIYVVFVQGQHLRVVKE